MGSQLFNALTNTNTNANTASGVNAANLGNILGSNQSNIGMDVLRNIFSFISGAANAPANAGVLGSIAGGGLNVLNNIGTKNYLNTMNDRYNTEQTQKQSSANLNRAIFNVLNSGQLGGNAEINKYLGNGVQNGNAPIGFDVDTLQKYQGMLGGQNSLGAVQAGLEGGGMIPQFQQGHYYDPNNAILSKYIGQVADQITNIANGNQIKNDILTGYGLGSGAYAGTLGKPSTVPTLDTNVNNPLSGGVSKVDLTGKPILATGASTLPNFNAGIGLNQSVQDNALAYDKLLEEIKNNLNRYNIDLGNLGVNRQRASNEYNLGSQKNDIATKELNMQERKLNQDALTSLMKQRSDLLEELNKFHKNGFSISGEAAFGGDKNKAQVQSALYQSMQAKLQELDSMIKGLQTPSGSSSAGVGSTMVAPSGSNKTPKLVY